MKDKYNENEKAITYLRRAGLFCLGGCALSLAGFLGDAYYCDIKIDKFEKIDTVKIQRLEDRQNLDFKLALTVPLILYASSWGLVLTNQSIENEQLRLRGFSFEKLLKDDEKE